MFNKANRNAILGILAVSLISIFSLTLTKSGTSLANSHTGTQVLKCAGLVKDGMTLSYDSLKNSAVVTFLKQKGATSPSKGHCILEGTPWNSKSVGTFCHFGVDDVIYKKNSISMNIISRKAPYLLQILKNGGNFSLNVRSGDTSCPNGLIVSE